MFIRFACAFLAIVACAGERSPPLDARSSGAARRALEIVANAGASDARLRSLASARSAAFVRAPEGTVDDAETRGRIVSEGWRSTKEQRFSDLGARLPDTAEGAIDVGVSRFEARQIHVRLRNALPAPATLAEGRVVYPNALPSVDRVLLSNAVTLEELLVVHEASVLRSFSWRMDFPTSVARAVQKPDGGFSEARVNRGPSAGPRLPPRATATRWPSIPCAARWCSSAGG